MQLRSMWPFGKKPPTTEKGFVDTMEGGLNTEWDLGWWQQDKQPRSLGPNGVVEACVSALAQTAAMCPIHLKEEQDDGENKRLRGAQPERVMLNPNKYESRTLFIVNAIRSLYLDGNAYAVTELDGNNAIRALHLMNPRATAGAMDPETGEIFYYASPHHDQPFTLETDRVFPARRVMHLRMHTTTNPLKGETPIAAAARAITANSSLVAHQANFFGNMSRPSGVLSSDQMFNKEQMNALRAAWTEQSKGIDSGGVPILGGGLKWNPMSISSQDSQLVEAYGMTVGDISRVLRVPLAVINDMTGSTFNNTEALMSFFLSSGLGFLLEHFELELGRVWDLPYGRKFNFDTSALLRLDLKSQIEAYGEATSKGLYAIDEGRKKLGLGAVPGGHGAMPRVQQQMVRLDWEPEPAAPEQPAPEPAMDEPTIELALRRAMEPHHEQL